MNGETDWFKSAATKSANKDYHGAIADLNKAIELNPNDLDAYLKRGSAKVCLENFQAALADFNKAIELNPDFAVSYNLRGGLKVLLKDYQGAIADFNKAFELKPDYGENYADRGVAYLDLDQKSKALADFMRAKDLGFSVPQELLDRCKRGWNYDDMAWTLVLSTGGFRFQQLPSHIDVPNPYPKNLNSISSLIGSCNTVVVAECSNKIVFDVQTVANGFLSRKAQLLFKLSNSRQLLMQPVGSEFLDMEIHFSKLNLTYLPKGFFYNDVSGRSKTTFEDLAMKFPFEETVFLFKGLRINKVIAHCQTNELTRSTLTNAVTIEGMISFSTLEEMNYDHDDNIICHIYPDRMYSLLSRGESVMNMKMGVQLSLL